MRFVVMIDYNDLAARERVLPAHREHLRLGREAGTVIESGPFVDGKGGMYILECRDEAEARAFVAADPYTGAGLRLSVRAWKPT